MKAEYQQQLLDAACLSIRYGLEYREALPVHLDEYNSELTEDKASFVTLNINSQLRGCIGSLIAHRPLVVDIAENAFSAAFKDPRFPPLSEAEFESLDYHISILSKPRPIKISSEEELLSELDVGVDGLILNDGFHRATFLPSVWEQLSDKQDFLRHLKAKAGLPYDYWSDSIEFERYSVESFGT